MERVPHGFEHLLSKLKVEANDEEGASIQLIDFEHMDYIEDVFAEHFDMEYDCKIVDEQHKRFILFFGDLHSIIKVTEIAKQINAFHKSYRMLYSTV